MKIGELARQTGASVRSLRHYEQEGLIESVRGENGYRHYDLEAVGRVRQIRGMIEAGLPTRLIREVMPYVDSRAEVMPESPCGYLIDEAVKRREQLDRRIELLTRDREAIDAYLRMARKRAAA